MKMKIASIVIIALACAASYGFYMFNKPVKSLEHQKAMYSVSARDLFREYQENEFASNTKYLGKILNVKGKIADIETDEHGTVTIHLETEEPFRVSCQMASRQKNTALTLEKNTEVAFKGICSGMLMDVVLMDCVPSK